MRTSTLVAVMATSAAAMAGAGEAAAAPSVSGSSARANGNQAVVTGTAAFPAIGAQSVVGPSAVRAAGAVSSTPLGEAAGLGLTDAQITPLANGSGLRFSWVVSSLPQETPPEGVRYTWGFAVGESAYQLSAKRTNATNINTTEDPVGTVEHAAAQRGFFELRGACTASYKGVPLSGCYRLAFVNGRFDAAAKTVSLDLPYRTRDSIGRLVAPDFVPGAVVVDSGVGSAGGTIQAAFQAVISNGFLANTISAVDPYYVGPKVSLAIGKASANARSLTYTTTAALAADGTFSGTVNGLTADARTVFIRACNGVECAYAQQAVE